MDGKILANPSTADTLRMILRDTLQIGERAKAMQPGSPLLGRVPELDSLAVASVVTAIEERFHIVVDDDEISAELFETFVTLTDFVHSKLRP